MVTCRYISTSMAQVRDHADVKAIRAIACPLSLGCIVKVLATPVWTPRRPESRQIAFGTPAAVGWIESFDHSNCPFEQSHSALTVITLRTSTTLSLAAYATLPCSLSTLRRLCGSAAQPREVRTNLTCMTTRTRCRELHALNAFGRKANSSLASYRVNYLSASPRDRPYLTLHPDGIPVDAIGFASIRCIACCGKCGSIRRRMFHCCDVWRQHDGSNALSP